MIQQVEEILDAITAINIELNAQYENIDNRVYQNAPMFRYHTNGLYDWITFGDEFVWQDDDDPRWFDDDKDEHEPMKDFLVRWFFEFKSTMNTLELT